MEYLSLGKIVGPFGIDGTIRVFSTTDNAPKRYKKGAEVFLYNEKTGQHTKYVVISYKMSGKFDLVKLEGIDTPEKVDEFRNNEIHVLKDTSDLEVGYYFYSDLVGCKILDQNNNELGIVSKVEEFPAQITLRVKRNNQKDFFVPFIKQFIISVDIFNKSIIINVIEGLL
jgi:16S rRNA processing protein RimM